MPPSKPLPTSMVAWQHHPGFFSSSSLTSKLKLNQTAPVPQLKKSQTLVKVLSACVNPIDYKLGELAFAGRLAFGSPATPGLDYVGRVWDTNLPESEGVKPGDLVWGKIDPGPFGTLGAFTVVSGTESISKAPEGVDIDWLGSAGTVALTAYQSLVPRLEDKGEGSARGKSVLINGGSGGVGTYTVQFAKAIGCEHIVATCSAANAELVRGLGATEVIDYRSTDVATAAKDFVTSKMGGKKFDLVVDNAGTDMNIYYQSHHFLKEKVNYVFVGAGISLQAIREITVAMSLPAFLGGAQRKLEFLSLKSNRKHYDRIGQWMKDGSVKGIIDSTFPMEEAVEAYKKLKTGRARGKIVVRVSEDGRGAS